MLNKFNTWRYSETTNCWDFVREFLEFHCGIDDLLKYDIKPENKISMTVASNKIEHMFKQVEPVDYSIACQYRRNYLYHVGVVLDGMVHHVSKKGYRIEPIDKFSAQAKTIYMLHNKLWQR